MELSALRNFKMALNVTAAGDARSPIGRFRDQEDEDELRSERSNASSRSSGVAAAATATAVHGAQVNLPLDKEFVPLAHHHDDEQDDDAAGREAMAARDDVRDDVIRMIFDLPDTTKFYQDFSCAIAATLAMHGRMYPTNTHVCFYSNVFGRERKILIPYESISEVAKTTTMVFQHAIRLATTAKDEYTFTSFWGANRDACYELIVKTRSRVLNELKPAGAHSLKVSTTESRPPNSSSSSSESVTSPVSTSAAVQQLEADSVDTDATPDDRTDDTAADDERPASPLPVEQDRDAATLSSPSSSVRRASVVSDIDSVAPRDISMTEIVIETFDVSADDFMREFFWDGAPFGLDAFGATQGYSEMKVNPWMTPLEDDSSFGKTRSLQFRVPVDAPIGPKSSQVDVLQCAKTDERGRIHVIETSTRLVDIPYGDYFSVEDRWTLVPRDTTPPSCTLCIELKVVFSKSTFWKGKIEARAIADNKTKWCEWVERAKQHLADKRTRAAARDVASVAQQSSSECAQQQQTVDSSGHAQRLSHQLAPQSSSTSSRTPKRHSSRATLSHRSSRGSTQSAARGPSASFILYLRVFPWILVLGLLFLVVRMQSSLAHIELTLVATSAEMSAIERQLASLTAACPVAGV